MHLLFFSHSYPGHLERFMDEIGARGYVDSTTAEKVRYRAIWRQIQLWDVLLPEGCKDDFMADMACFYPGEDYLRRHTPGLERAVRWLRRAVQLLGGKPLRVEKPDKPRYPSRRIDGKQCWVWMIPVADLGELRDDSGRELW